MKVEHNIETPRMIIRSYQDDDRAFCISLWCDPVNGKYMSDPSVDCLNEKYIKCFEGMEDEDDAYYLIATDKETGAAIGTCCLFPEEDNYDIGYCISKHLWKKGLGSELIQAIIEFARELGGRTLTAEVADENIASVKLLKKFDFESYKVASYKKWNSEVVFDSQFYKLAL
ncbi:GNAT family N-acetyltransferase [Pseudobutyrivibrio xylanivorans]|uniref:Acetyltransferase (GNAT) domain-containing protein n=1 Tax=Pseudobutyrivibrio xylanivorans DSM 14809 TaxID=1123012 RepID=A0A1M6FQW2_PSEXY|nr:GNAT family N-acetyltransferase [Pseudobutyrivibrio xylanivorans]SHJ00046.1 Acetyltransferase (GNAT) domain-containing protein [Pseudobutyrivibrio xylanivorans DSM 14809]